MGSEKKQPTLVAALPIPPRVVLHRTLEAAEDIASIVVMIEHKDGSISMDSSSQDSSDLIKKSVVFSGKVYYAVFNQGE